MGQLFLISLASVGVLSLSSVCGAKSGLTVGPLEIERDGAKAIVKFCSHKLGKLHWYT